MLQAHCIAQFLVTLGPFHTSEKISLFRQIFCHYQCFTNVDHLVCHNFTNFVQDG